MNKRPLAERVAEYLFSNPFAKYIPLHPEDTEDVDSLIEFKLPVYILGSGIPLERRENTAITLEKPSS